MKFSLTLLLILFCSQIIAQNNDSMIVRKTAESFLNSYKKMDYERAKKMGTDSTAMMLDMMGQFLPMMPDSILDLTRNSIITIVSVQISDRIAFVTYIQQRSEFNSAIDKIAFIKVKNKWLADLKLPQAPQIEEQQRQEPIRKED